MSMSSSQREFIVEFVVNSRGPVCSERVFAGNEAMARNVITDRYRGDKIAFRGIKKVG